MKYKVTLNDNTYFAEVEALDKRCDEIERLKEYDTSGAGVAFDAAKNEYEHSFQRSEKLDNKIYILLTVCAFFFVLLTDLIKGISEIEFPNTQTELALVITFSILMFLSVALFVLMLIWLIKLLKGIELNRIDASEIVSHNMANAKDNQVAGFIIMRYEQCRNHNNDLVEDRFKAFNKCVTLLVVNAIVLLMLAFMRNFV